VAKSKAGARRLTSEPLHVAAELLGQPLASPLRRLVAYLLDGAILILPSIAVAVGAAYVNLRLNRPEVLRAVEQVWSQDGAKAKVSLDNRKAMARYLSELEAPGLPVGVREAVERGELDRAAELVDGLDYLFALAFGEEPEVHLKPRQVMVPVEKMIPKPLRALCLFGVGALYFTFLTSSRRGATLGKRLAGIRVVQLGGERLSRLESLERFAGYLEIPATGGLVLLHLWKDPNRRLPHDRVAHTAVLRVVKPPRVAAA